MPTDYDKLYQEQPHVLGKPTQAFVDFFDTYDTQNANVLDVGCGQGRDALFIARLGHRVVGVDLSPTGIKQLLKDAKAENLKIEGIVADLREFTPEREFDVVVIDRTLHMLLDADVRLQALVRVCTCVVEGGYVLIADEKSNLPAMRTFFEKDSHSWETMLDQKGCLFVRKQTLADH
jgi:tellurite methyltransferase